VRSRVPGRVRETREKRGERELGRGESKGDDDDGELVGVG
jgi:hypothetical protein